MSLCPVPCVRVARYCSKLHTASAFPVSVLNFTPLSVVECRLFPAKGQPVPCAPSRRLCLGLGLAYDACACVLTGYEDEAREHGTRAFAAFASGRRVSLVPHSRCACPCACVLCVSAFPVSVLNFTPTAEGMRQHAVHSPGCRSSRGFCYGTEKAER
eukprot:7388481-Prymnesium_polylepis.1